MDWSTALWMGIGACIGSTLLSIYLGLSGLRLILYNGILSGSALFIQQIFLPAQGLFLSTLAASIIVALCAQAGARYFKSPISVFLIPMLYSLVPGTQIYLMVLTFLSLEEGNTVQYGTEALVIALGIALGILFVETLMTLYDSIRKKEKRREA